MEEKIKCPKCGSEQIAALKKGFSGGKAAAGAVLTGGIGLLAGFHGSGKVKVACMACGNKWDPVELADHQKTQKNQQAIKAHKEWQKEFYIAYNSNNLQLASDIYTRKFAYTKELPDLHAGYKRQKKNDTEMAIFMIVGSIIVIGIFSLFVNWLF